MDFVKEHEEFTTRLMSISRIKQGRSVPERCLPTVTTCLSRCARPDLTRKGHIMEKLTQSKFGQAPKDMAESQNWIQDQFHFLKSHIRCKGLSQSARFKSQVRGDSASAVLAHNIFRLLPT